MKLKMYPSEFLYNDAYLDTANNSYQLYFEPYDTDVFTEFVVEKVSGSGDSARGTESYEELDSSEIDWIVWYVISTSLGLDDFDVKII